MDQVKTIHSLVNEIYSALRGQRLPISDEKELQKQMRNVFERAEIDVKSEYRLDDNNIVDFFYCGLAIEVKIKSPARSVYRQCERYCNFDEVKAIILITSKAMGFPPEINGKDCFFLNLAKAWL